jgi:integrase
MRLCRIAVNRFVSAVVFPNDQLCATCREVRTQDLGDRVVAHRRGIPRENSISKDDADNWVSPVIAIASRDHFTEAEVAAILTVVQDNARDHIMLRIMSETGLRRRAVSWLTVDAVYDHVAQTALPVATAVEKGLVLRQFQLSETTRLVLTDYVKNHLQRPHHWLFPSPCHDGQRPIGSHSINHILRRACRKAGISGRHVHSHAMRKFVVCRLMAARNRVEDVAKWIGHRSVNITYKTYWDWNLQELVEGMKIPWMLTNNENVDV